METKIQIIKRNGNKEDFNPEKIKVAIRKSAERVMIKLTPEAEDEVSRAFLGVHAAQDKSSCPGPETSDDQIPEPQDLHGPPAREKRQTDVRCDNALPQHRKDLPHRWREKSPSDPL